MKPLKILICLSVITALCSFHNGKNIKVSSGLYINGKLVSPLQSAYSGGSIFDPDKGVGFRLNLLDTPFEEFPRRGFSGDSKANFEGIRYKDVNYTKPGQFIDNIYVDGLSIPLEQGIYKGGNPKVKSVVFEVFSIQIGGGNANIKVTINLEDNRRIDIIYNGQQKLDGMF